MLPWPRESHDSAANNSVIGWPTRLVLLKRRFARRCEEPLSERVDPELSGRFHFGQVKQAEKGLIWALVHDRERAGSPQRFCRIMT
jgi:hypothetical protein